jgi:hypothetical protein
MQNNIEYQNELPESWGWFIDIDKKSNSLPKYNFTNQKIIYDELDPIEEEKNEINNILTFKKISSFIQIVFVSGIIFYIILFVI